MACGDAAITRGGLSDQIVLCDSAPRHRMCNADAVAKVFQHNAFEALLDLRVRPTVHRRNARERSLAHIPLSGLNKLARSKAAGHIDAQ
jgi:hypothetical protein